MKVQYLTLALFLSVSSVMGQMKVTTSVGAQTKIGESQVTTSGSGSMVYSIPLFNIESGGVKLPISLIYDGSGVSVNSKASWVGQNWSLSYGGKISREQHGSPDDVYIQNSSDEDYNGIRGYLNGIDYFYDIAELKPVHTNISNRAHRGLYDLRPDIFRIETPFGLTDEFSVKRKSSLMPSDEIDVNDYEFVSFQKGMSDLVFSTSSNRQINTFKVSDRNGRKFVFGYDGDEGAIQKVTAIQKINSAIPGEQQDLLYSYNGEWLISKVFDDNDKLIYDFDYGYHNYAEQLELNYWVWMTRSPNDVANSMDRSGFGDDAINKRVRNRELSEIRYDGGIISFEIGDLREDIPDLYELGEIKQTDKEGNLLRRYVFHYQYVGTEVDGNVRMYLSSIEEYNSQNVLIETINLDYNAGEIPIFPSNERDVWGGYNGPNTEIDWETQMERGIFTRPEPESNPDLSKYAMRLFIWDYLERPPSYTYATIGALNRISDSKGRSIEFEYELNEFSKVNHSGELIDVVNHGQFHEEEFYPETYTNELTGVDFYEDNIEIEVLLDHSQWIQVKFTPGDPIGANPFPCVESMVVENYFNGNRHSHPLQLDQFTGELDYNQWTWLYVEEGEDLNFIIDPAEYNTINPGVCPVNPSATSQPHISVKYFEKDVSEGGKNKEAGGLRLKKIVSDSNSGDRMAKMYSYNLFSDSLTSSGVLLNSPMKVNSVGVIEEDDETDDIHTLLSTSSLSEKSLSGNIIYSNIETKTCPCDQSNICIVANDIENATAIKRDFFNFNLNDNPLVANYPYLPSWENSSQRILLNKTEYLDWNYNVLETDSFDYSLFDDFLFSDTIEGIQTTLYKYTTSDFEAIPATFKNWRYKLSPELTKLTRTFKRGNIDSKTVETSSKVEYYDDGYYDLVTRKEDDKSDGSKVITLFSYSGTFNFNEVTPLGENASAIRAMQDNGNYHAPVESITFVESFDGASYTILKHEIFIYRLNLDGSIQLDKRISRIHESNFSSEPNLISLTAAGEYIVAVNSTDKEVNYTKYEEDNFLLEWNSESISHSLIYDSDDKVNNAKVTNGKHSTSRYTSFESDFHGGWQLSEDDMENNIVDATANDYAITGDKYYDLGVVGSNNGQFNSGVSTNPFPAGKYLLSYWKKGYVNPALSGSGTILNTHALEEGDWTYVEHEIAWTSENNYVTMGGDGFIDELRFHEIDAAMETSGYYRDGRPKYNSGPTGNVITYEYDYKGRLEWLLGRERNVIEHHAYEEKDIADTTSYNKHVLYSVRKEGMSKTDVQNASISNDDVKRTITYTDGLGRSRQSIAMNVDASNADAVGFTKYDAFGRSLKSHLPYYAHLGNDDDYILDAETQQLAYYQNQDDDQENTTKPFAEKKLEATPLQRPIEQGGIGEELQLGGGHTTQMEYGWNEATDQILKWNYDESTEVASVGTGADQYWAPQTLRKTTVTSPDGVVSAVFKDARGREVARTVYADLYGDKTTGDIGQTGSKTAHQVTQYSVYDDFNRLRFDISPKAVQALENAGSYTLNPAAPSGVFEEHISFYGYDEKGRLQKRFSPGSQFVEYVYDTRDRVILTRDAMQTVEGKWSFVKFDSRGRAILTGEYESTNDRAYHQQWADAHSEYFETTLPTLSGSIYNYTDVAYPTGISHYKVYKANYYDSYEFSHTSTFDFVPFNGITVPLEVTRGLPTGSRVRVFDGAVENDTYTQNLVTVTYYDEDARPIQAITENHKGGWDRIDTYYNDYGQVEKTVQTHLYDANSDEHTFTTRFTYVNQTGQLKNTYCQLDDDPEILVSNRFYDEKGQLKDLKLHNTDAASNYIQYVDYRYNAQGRLTHINNTALIDDGIYNHNDDDIFGQELTYFEESPEYDNPGNLPAGNPLANYKFNPQYGGNVSSMMWNAKAPEEDGTTLSRSVYVFDYDDLGQMTHAYYAADDPAMPGEFVEDLGHFDEHANYDLGGNIVKLNRHNPNIPSPINTLTPMDELSYTYDGGGYRLKKVDDAGWSDMSNQYKHFVDGVNQSKEYLYDAGGKLTEDKNKNLKFAYNPINLPRKVALQGSGYHVKYTYDAAGNKLQKYHQRPTDSGPCTICGPYATDYIGNFVYENGELKMVYYPEGVIRPTPAHADNETDYVYDYFVKDYLGNVRAVITEEDATFTDKFLATMEEVHAVIEEENFDNINETREDLPTGYPADGSMYLNEKVATLSAENDTEMGPSLVMPVKRGDRVGLSSKYFYEEDAPGTVYDDLGHFVNEILIALATSGAGVLPLNENQLIGIASGDPAYVQSVTNLLDNSFDDRDIHKPNAYLVWMLYDKNMHLIPSSSGAIQVQNPNALETLISNAINISHDGYLHAYVSNGSSKGVHFDQFLVKRQRGKVRQINDYYPYGLTLTGLNGDGDEYLNKYTSKELQTGEFDATVSTGMEMFDFGSRYYDPQLGRWFTPDPAEQFTNPYLGIGNNPAVYVDPNGEFAELALFTVYAMSKITVAALAATAVTAAAGLTAGIVVNTAPALTSGLAPSSVGSSSPNPPDTYRWNPDNPNQLEHVNYNGGSENHTVINTKTGEVLHFQGDNSGFVTMEQMSNIKGYFNPNMYQINYPVPMNGISTIGAGPVNSSFVGPVLQTGTTNAAGLSPAAGAGAGFNPLGLGIAGLGGGLSAGSYSYFNKQGWYSTSQQKFYNHNFHGNQYTGAGRSGARGVSSAFKWGGRGLGAYNAFSIYQSKAAGEINNTQFVLEQGSNAISTFAPNLYGAAWGIGWELGRAVTTIPGYHEYIRVPVQRFFGWRP